jgi:hypothetical protein
MKKIIFSIFLLASVITLSAQEVTVYRLGTTGTNPALSVPSDVRMQFETAYPNVTVVTWQPVSSFWRAAYTMDNRITHVYYNDRGDTYRVALPVLNGMIEEDVIETAIRLHGANLYSITRMKASNDAEVYKLQLMDNGAPKDIWINAEGTEVFDVYKIKVDEDDNEVKIKKDDDM